MIKIFFILIVLLITNGCSSVPRCSEMKPDIEQEECREADRRFQSESGWRYYSGRDIRGDFR